MNKTLKITKIGNSAGVILPKEVLAKLRAEVGDALFLTAAPDGVRLTAADPDFAEKMKVAEKIMREDRDPARTGEVAPAFGLTHDDQTIWNTAAFVNQLPDMSEEHHKA